MISFGLASSVSSVCFANNIDLASGYANTQEVFDYGRKVQTVKQQLAQGEYQLQSCQTHAVHYFTQPSDSTYYYGKTECTYKIPTDSPFSLQRDYAKLNIDLYFNQVSYLFHQGPVSVQYYTVY
jgi:hypothetical protein